MGGQRPGKPWIEGRVLGKHCGTFRRGTRLVANLTGDVRAFRAPAGWRVLLDSEDVRFAGRNRDPLGPHQAILYEVVIPERRVKTR
jgi:hypothetical protein